MSVSLEELKHAIKAVVREEMVSQQNQPTETHVDHVCGCPDCYCGVIEKMNETSDYVCANCGLPLGNKEFASKIEKCPNCAHTKALEVHRRV